jgi:nucleoside-diphosphate-sugar epimerase
MNFVVLGSTGFIGKNIYTFLKKNINNNVVGVSTKTVNLSEAGSHKILEKVIPLNSVLIMCIGVKKQLGDDIDIFEENVVIIDNFIRVIISSAPKKIIFFSSTSVYGEDFFHAEKINERTSLENRSYYGLAKHMSELLLDKACSEIKTKLVILRPPLIYGDGDTSFGYGPTGFLYKALNKEEIIIWGDGNELREFIYIDDIVYIINHLIYSDFEGILNIVSGISYTYSDIINIIRNDININVEATFRDRSKDKVDHIFSNSLTEEILNKFQFTSLGHGIKLMQDSMQKNITHLIKT